MSFIGKLSLDNNATEYDLGDGTFFKTNVRMGGFTIAYVKGASKEESINFAKRIVACVNALDGISSEVLLPGGMGAILAERDNHIAKLTQDIVELKEYIEELRSVKTQ